MASWCDFALESPFSVQCSGHGSCIADRCVCDPGWSGNSDLIQLVGRDCHVNLTVITVMWCCHLVASTMCAIDCVRTLICLTSDASSGTNTRGSQSGDGANNHTAGVGSRVPLSRDDGNRYSVAEENWSCAQMLKQLWQWLMFKNTYIVVEGLLQALMNVSLACLKLSTDQTIGVDPAPTALRAFGGIVFWAASLQFISAWLHVLIIQKGRMSNSNTGDLLVRMKRGFIIIFCLQVIGFSLLFGLQFTSDLDTKDILNQLAYSFLGSTLVLLMFGSIISGGLLLKVIADGLANANTVRNPIRSSGNGATTTGATHEDAMTPSDNNGGGGESGATAAGRTEDKLAFLHRELTKFVQFAKTQGPGNAFLPLLIAGWHWLRVKGLPYFEPFTWASGEIGMLLVFRVLFPHRKLKGCGRWWPSMGCLRRLLGTAKVGIATPLEAATGDEEEQGQKPALGITTTADRTTTTTHSVHHQSLTQYVSVPTVAGTAAAGRDANGTIISSHNHNTAADTNDTNGTLTVTSISSSNHHKKAIGGGGNVMMNDDAELNGARVYMMIDSKEEEKETGRNHDDEDNDMEAARHPNEDEESDVCEDDDDENSEPHQGRHHRSGGDENVDQLPKLATTTTNNDSDNNSNNTSRSNSVSSSNPAPHPRLSQPLRLHPDSLNRLNLLARPRTPTSPLPPIASTLASMADLVMPPSSEAAMLRGASSNSSSITKHQLVPALDAVSPTNSPSVTSRPEGLLAVTASFQQQQQSPPQLQPIPSVQLLSQTQRQSPSQPHAGSRPKLHLMSTNLLAQSRPGSPALRSLTAPMPPLSLSATAAVPDTNSHPAVTSMELNVGDIIHRSSSVTLSPLDLLSSVHHSPRQHALLPGSPAN